MFRSQGQQALACMVLCDSLPATRGLWTEDGPTKKASRPGPMSSGERIVLKIAFAVWSGRGTAKISEVLNVLDSARLRLVGSLLVALGSDRSEAAIDRWILDHMEVGPTAATRALERGLRDGARLQSGEVTPAELERELREFPPGEEPEVRRG